MTEREALARAYEAGALAVHQAWRNTSHIGEGPPRGDPDFSEAANDYARSAAPTPAVPGPEREALALLRDLRPHVEALSVTDEAPEYKVLLRRVDAVLVRLWEPMLDKPSFCADALRKMVANCVALHAAGNSLYTDGERKLLLAAAEHIENLFKAKLRDLGMTEDEIEEYIDDLAGDADADED